MTNKMGVHLLLIFLQIISPTFCENICIAEICIPQDYSSAIVPDLDDGNKVELDISDIQILNVNDFDCTVTVFVYLQVIWKEPRIITPDEMTQSGAMDQKFLDLLWIPDIQIYNLKDFNKIGLIQDTSRAGGLSLVGDNLLMFDLSFEATIYCQMRFESYPLDFHICDFIMASWMYDETVLNLTVSNLNFDSENQITLLDYEAGVRNLSKSKEREVFADTYFKTCGFEIALTRNVNKYIVNYYIPSGTLVLVSWISYVIPNEAIPGRMALLIILTLTAMNLMIGIFAKSPNSKSITSISSWMMFCAFFIEAALFEYAAVLFIKHIWPDCNPKMLKRVDTFSLMISVLIFALFNMIFWSSM